VSFHFPSLTCAPQSSAGGDLFAGLSSQKRGSIDHQARKSSFDEMKPGSQGVLAGMWNNFMKK
jgi:hypothetical protein